MPVLTRTQIATYAVAALIVVVLAVRARPWHAGMAAFVARLIAGPRAPICVLIVALVVPALASRTAARIALPIAVLAGGVVAQARIEVLDATHLTGRIGHAVDARVVLLETPRLQSFGTRVATVRLDGERVLVRA